MGRGTRFGGKGEARDQRSGLGILPAAAGAGAGEDAREFSRRGDEWLDEQTPFWGGRPANNYFKWFHVFEDELNHRGQIRWLRKRTPGANVRAKVTVVVFQKSVLRYNPYLTFSITTPRFEP